MQHCASSYLLCEYVSYWSKGFETIELVKYFYFFGQILNKNRGCWQSWSPGDRNNRLPPKTYKFTTFIRQRLQLSIRKHYETNMNLAEIINLHLLRIDITMSIFNFRNIIESWLSWFIQRPDPFPIIYFHRRSQIWNFMFGLKSKKKIIWKSR